MKRVLYIVMFALALCGCNGQRKGDTGNGGNEVSRGLAVADSIRARQFVLAIRDAGFWAQLWYDKKHLVIGTDTTGMTGSVDNLARRFFQLAKDQRVVVRRCIVIDYRTKDTLAVYE